MSDIDSAEIVRAHKWRLVQQIHAQQLNPKLSGSSGMVEHSVDIGSSNLICGRILRCHASQCTRQEPS